MSFSLQITPYYHIGPSPPRYQTRCMSCVTGLMMLSISLACIEKRLRISSSHSIHDSPIFRMVDGKLYVAAGDVQCFVSEGAVHLNPPWAADACVNGCTFCDSGVWLSITSGAFWLEVRVPTRSEREIQARAQRK